MKKMGALALAGLLALACFTFSAQAGIRDERPNIVGCELLGRGLLLTLNYEHFFTNSFGLGAGIMAIGAGGGGVLILPAYASFAPGNVHSPYLGVGLTLLSGGGEIDDFSSTLLANFALGYQYQSENGFFIRPMFTLNTSLEHDVDALLWPGVTIGGSF